MPMRRAGLTLIEVLVGLTVMAAMALMGRSVIDSMLRSVAFANERSSQLSGLQMGLSQWSRDLDHLSTTPYVNALQWNGQVLRLVRRSSSEDALWVVAWTLHGGLWRRWQSAPIRDRQTLVKAWQESASSPGMGQSQALGSVVDLMPLSRWQIQFWTDGRWSEAGATGNTSDAADDRLVQAPLAVRLHLSLTDRSNTSTGLKLDWMDRSQP